MTHPTRVTTLVSALKATSPFGQPDRLVRAPFRRAKYQIHINAPVLVCVSVFLRQLLLRSDFTELSF